MLDKSKVYMPNFTSPKGECRNCGKELSDHDYISSQWYCIANTAEAMKEIMATIAQCNTNWQMDIMHGFYLASETERRWAVHYVDGVVNAD